MWNNISFLILVGQFHTGKTYIMIACTCDHDRLLVGLWVLDECRRSCMCANHKFVSCDLEGLGSCTTGILTKSSTSSSPISCRTEISPLPMVLTHSITASISPIDCISLEKLNAGTKWAAQPCHSQWEVSEEPPPKDICSVEIMLVLCVQGEREREQRRRLKDGSDTRDCPRIVDYLKTEEGMQVIWSMQIVMWAAEWGVPKQLADARKSPCDKVEHEVEQCRGFFFWKHLNQKLLGPLSHGKPALKYYNSTIIRNMDARSFTALIELHWKDKRQT